MEFSQLDTLAAQDELKGSDAHWNWLTPRPGGASMPFAWDEPLAPHKLRVHVSDVWNSEPVWICSVCPAGSQLCLNRCVARSSAEYHRGQVGCAFPCTLLLSGFRASL